MADGEEDVLDNWEDEDTEVLERRMEERQKQHVKGKKKQSQIKTASANKTQEDVPVTPLEVQTHLPLRTVDTGRTEYVAPIKILKRQVDAKGASATQTNTTTTVQRKSLAEREADYASARARILGTGYRSADEVSGPPTITTKSSPSPSPSSSRGGPGPPLSSSHGTGPSPSGPGLSPSSSRMPGASSRGSPSSSRGPGDSQTELVKRQPKGPNGTKGFKTKAKS